MHGQKGDMARGLGEVTIAALLLSSYTKAGERVNLNAQGSGLYLQGLAEAYSDGRVRAYVVERPADQVSEEELKVTGPWGGGFFSVLRTQDKEGKQPYIGTVPILTGHMAKDLSYYYVQSEQVPSACGIAVKLTDDGKVAAAGGFLIQAMPGAEDSELKSMEDHIQSIQDLGKELVDDRDPIHLLSRIFQNTPFMILENRELRFECQCSWDRVMRAMALVGAKEIRSMLADQGTIEIRCDFCNKLYELKGEDLEKFLTSEDSAEDSE